MKVAEQYFGSHHADRLREWASNGSNDVLTPDEDGIYECSDGARQTVPQPSTFVQAPLDIDALHLLWNETFGALVTNITQGGNEVHKLVESLGKHRDQYKSTWANIDRDPSKKEIFHFQREIDWQEIADALGNIQTGGSSAVTTLKLAESQWKMFTGRYGYGFPEQWDRKVHDQLISKVNINYTQAVPPRNQATAEKDSEDDPQEESSVGARIHHSASTPSSPIDDKDSTVSALRREISGLSINPGDERTRSKAKKEDNTTSDTTVTDQDIPMKDAPVPVFQVEDGGILRDVLAISMIGRGEHLILRMTPPDANFHLYDMVPGTLFRASIKKVKEKPDHDFKNMRGSTHELRDMDYSDFEWAGIVTQRRATEPPSGRQPITYVLRQSSKGLTQAFSRSEFGSAFGRAQMDVYIDDRRASAGGQRRLTATRQQMAIQYDVESDDDHQFVTAHPDDTQKLLQNEAQPEQRENDKVIETLGSQYRTTKAFSPPKNQAEVVAMQEAIKLFERGEINTRIYGR